MRASEQLSLTLGTAGGERSGGEALRVRAQALSDDLASRLKRPVKLTVTDNRSSVLTIREADEAFVIRAHHIFLEADARVRDALVAYALGRKKRSAGRCLDAFIEAHGEKIRQNPSASPQAPAHPAGRHHDLQRLFDRINAEYFSGKVVARIGWGKWGPRKHRRRRSIKMGTYLPEARLIRIHPALDQAVVPEFYLAWVVFHEMLHQIVPPRKRNGRMAFHPPAFRRLEMSFESARAARAWEEANFELLLGPAPMSRKP